MNETNAHGTNRLFLITTNWDIMCIEKNERNQCIYCLLNQFKFELCWLKLSQISLYLIITKLNRVCPIACRAKSGIIWSPLFCINSASKYHVIRNLTNETHIHSCFTHVITKTLTAKRSLKKQSREDLVPSKVCKTSLIQLPMHCIHERMLSTVGEVGLEVILNIAFILFSPMP
jgi:hypothetical protein